MSASIQAVHEAIAIARKLRDAPNNGDAARHGVDVATHVLDVTRSGAASAGAAKVRHARAGAPLVGRVVWLVLMVIAVLYIRNVSASSITLTTTAGVTQCTTIVAATRNCADVKASATYCLQNNGYPSYSASTCTSDPVVVGTTINFTPSGYWNITGITGNCDSGYSWNTSTLTCVPTTPSVVCTPSNRTISPCPSGYAPKEITVQSSQQPDPYQSSFDALPLQEMLLALCIGVSGLFGFSVGVRLI